eukprot:RCo035249
MRKQKQPAIASTDGTEIEIEDYEEEPSRPPPPLGSGRRASGSGATLVPPSAGSPTSLNLHSMRSPSQGRVKARSSGRSRVSSDGGERVDIDDSDNDIGNVDSGSDSGRSCTSSKSYRSSVSTETGTRLRLADTDTNFSRRKFDAAIHDAFRKGDTAFLCNILGYEETIIELCALQKTSLVKKLLMTRPDLMVEADVFIPQPGVFLNESTTRSLSKAEYIKAYTAFNTVLFDLQVSEAVRKDDLEAIQSLPLLRLAEAAKESCRQGKEEMTVQILERLYRAVPSAADTKISFGKRAPVEVAEMYKRA